MSLDRKKPSFLKNWIHLITGTALAQVVPFLFLPILQRYFYSPSDFGLLALFTSTAQIFVAVASLKLEFGIVKTKDEINARNLTLLAISINISFSIILLITLFLLQNLIVQKLSNPDLMPYLFLIPLSMIGFGGFQIFTYWLNRSSEFKEIAKGKVVQSSSAEIFKILAGLSIFKANGLILGRVLGQLLGCIYMTRTFFKEWKNWKGQISITAFKKQFIKNLNFVKFSTPSALIGPIISWYYINFFMKQYGSDTTGFLGVSTIYISASLAILSSTFSQVFYKKITDTTSKKQLQKIYMQYLKILSFIAFLIIVMIQLIPNTVITGLLGEKWNNLLPYTRIMGIWLCISFISSSLSFIYIRLNKQKQMMFFDLFHLVIVIASLNFGHSFYGTPIKTLWVFCAGQSFYYILATFLAFYFIKIYNFNEEQ